ncbi:MAG TPA: heparinase II/III family protein [Capsulimonadaceae bacterium]|jgi:hypothetical protein
MKNLIHDDPTHDQIVAALSGPRPALLPAIGAPEWTRAAANPLVAVLTAPLREAAKREIHLPMPLLTDDLYADYTKTGTRMRFENMYFERRRQLARAAISALLTDGTERERYIASTVTKLTDIFEEKSWAVPAHVASENGKDPLFLDLFACETANLMAEMLIVFGADLPTELSVRIRERLRYTIFENYATHPDRHWWYSYTNNWNAVCQQGIVGAALAIETDIDLLARVLLTAKAGLPHFLEGFGDDGGCSEGPGYWSYGFGWFTLLNLQLETATSGKLSIIDNDPKIREIAQYAPRARFSNGYLINFADGPASGSINPFVLGYLGNRLGLQELLGESQNEYQRIVVGGFDAPGGRIDFFYLARLLLSFPAEIATQHGSPSRDYYFTDLQVITVRRKDQLGNLWEFAAKGGHNVEHHNHNDCGSFILHVNGQPIVTEIGAPEYNRRFFGATRYEHIASRTMGHSLPIINGAEQAEGPEYKAVVLKHELADDHVTFVLDLTAAYVAEARLRSLIRTLELNLNAGSLSVTDTYMLEEGDLFETAICTNRKVEMLERGPVIVAGSARVRIDADGVVFSTETHSYTDQQGAPASITRIVLTPRPPTNSGVVKYTLHLNNS